MPNEFIPPPWDVTDWGLTFLVTDAPLAKRQRLQSALGRMNVDAFYGHPPGSLQLRRLHWTESHRTRHRQPLWHIHSQLMIFRDVSELLSERRIEIHGGAFFNALPFGQRIQAPPAASS